MIGMIIGGIARSAVIGTARAAANAGSNAKPQLSAQEIRWQHSLQQIEQRKRHGKAPKATPAYRLAASLIIGLLTAIVLGGSAVVFVMLMHMQ